MKIDFLGIILLLGVVQGIFLSFILVFGKTGLRQTRFFLAFFMLVLSYDMAETLLSVNEIRLVTTIIFPYTLVITHGTHFYLIIKSGISRGKLPRKTILLCYSPAIADALIRILLFGARFNPIYTPAWLIENFESINAILSNISRISMILSFWVFFVLTVKEYFQLERNRIETLKTSLGISRQWLKGILVFTFFAAIIWSVIIFGVVLTNQQNNYNYYSPIQILALISLYLIGFVGYHRIRVIYVNEQVANQQYLENLSKEEIRAIINGLEKAMLQYKIYLDSELTLAKLSAHLGVQPRIISTVLNHYLQTNFNEYVNKYRVEEVKDRLLKSESRKQTILAVAFDSGFNSVPTFQRVFKNITGVTPKQFLTQNLQNR